MKPLHIVLLVLAGALGGAVVMKVAQSPRQAARPAPVEAQAPAPPVQPPVAEVKPTPAPEPPPAAVAIPEKAQKKKRPAARKHTPAPSSAVSKPAPQPEPVSIARTEPPPAPAPVPAVETPSPEPAPPARTEPENVTPPPPPPPHKVTLNAGMLIPVRLVDGLSSDRNAPGDTFTGTLDKELVVDGFVIAERGSRVEGRVVAADSGGRVKGIAGLAVELTRIRTSDGQNVAVQTDSFEKHAESSRNQDAAKVGIGAAIGAAIGAIAGGGKGAAIGAGVGGGAGAGDVLLTRGKPAALPSETRISFRLRAPVTVTERK